MDKNTQMFPSGAIVSIDGGIPKQASNKDKVAHLASLLPDSYKGEKIEHVMYNPKDGCVYGKTASKTIKKEIFAQSTQQDQTMPLDGTQKQKDNKVPSKPAKAKPETTKVTKDRPDVGKPTEVIKGGPERGSGSEDLHTDVVPRSSDDGVGGKKTKFEKEKADKATSGNSDTYVQKGVDSPKGSPAGSEANHAAGSEIKINHDQVIYQNLKLSKKDNDDDDNDNPFEKKDDKDDKKDKKDKKDDKKKDNLPPWLNKKDGDDDDDDDTDKEAASLMAEELKEASLEIEAKDKEINQLRMMAGRTKEATLYALSLLKLNPKKYANADTFSEFIETTASKQSIDSIKTAAEEVKTLIAEKQNINEAVIKSATVEGQNSVEAGIVTIMNTIDPDEGRFDKTASSKDDLKNILMANTKLGRDVADWDANYVASTPR